MCLQCKPLIKAIDAFLAKEDNDLAEQLTIEGYLEAEASVKTINEIEELVTALLEKNADELLAKLNDAVDLKTFFEDNWPDIKRTASSPSSSTTCSTMNLLPSCRNTSGPTSKRPTQSSR